MAEIETMSPEELAQWLTDKGFDDEVGKAFVGTFIYRLVNVINKRPLVLMRVRCTSCLLTKRDEITCSYNSELSSNI